IVAKIEEQSRQLGLTISYTKKKYMEDKEFKPSRHIRLKTTNGKIRKFEEVPVFTHPGTVIMRRPNTTKERKAKILNGVYALRSVLKGRDISKNTKTLTKADEKALCVWERKVLKKIFGEVRDGEGWKRRTNQNVKELYGESQRVRWFGHIIRMMEERLPKKTTMFEMGRKKEEEHLE
ncbi:hypothetical protein ILUMI_15114, partial [Ignelater luminosus]